MESLLSQLFPYQRRIVCDNARFKLLNCSRQCGKSTVFAVEAAINCAITPRTKWVALSRGERQVKEWIAKARQWSEAAAVIARDKYGVPLTVDGNASEVRFSNGATIIGIPANADTARGYSANIILDEFAYHEHADEIWAAVFPYITNEINEKFVMRVGSTVAGRNNKFWQLFEERNSIFRKYRITVEQAVAEGMPIDIPQLKRAIADPDIWRQEYECFPVEGSLALLSLDLIRAAQSADATRDYPLTELNGAGREFFAGVDIGRKNDLTVLWLIERIGNALITRAVVRMRHFTFEQQRERIFDFLRGSKLFKCAVDATGIGMQLGEECRTAFPSKVLAVNFSAQVKNELYYGMQRDFQSGEIKIPVEVDDGEASIEEDLHGVQRAFTRGGNVLFYAPHNEDGHSDAAAALALALYAARLDRKTFTGVATGALPPRTDGFFHANTFGIPSISGNGRTI